MKKIIGLMAAVGLTASVYANENTGCGLGSIIIKNQNTVVLQVLDVNNLILRMKMQGIRKMLIVKKPCFQRRRLRNGKSFVQYFHYGQQALICKYRISMCKFRK